MLRRGEVRRILMPVFVGNGREKIAQIEFKYAVRQRHDLDISYANHVRWHGSSSLVQMTLHYRILPGSEQVFDAA